MLLFFETFDAVLILLVFYFLIILKFLKYPKFIYYKFHTNLKKK